MKADHRPKKSARRAPRILAAALGLILCCGAVLSSCTPPPAVAHGNGLFSWSASVMEEGSRGALFDRMEELGLSELYQSIPKDADPETVQGFLEEAARREIAVYLLTGSPEWGLDPSGKAMRKEIDRAAGLPGAVRGVVMDTEPYLTDAWERDPDDVMERYVKAMVRTRRAAKKAELELVACIPYFYDTLGQGEGLEQLADGGCDALAVMNYYKGKEAEHIREEAALADTYGKPILTIYELQAPGEHGLTERNTYHDDGLDALYENWEALRRTFPEAGLTYALHEAGALEEVIGLE